jgi:hypothetical protein
MVRVNVRSSTYRTNAYSGKKILFIEAVNERFRVSHITVANIRRVEIREGMLHILTAVLDIQESQQAQCGGGILLGKSVSLPRHTDHQLLALHRAGEPVAQCDTPEEAEIRDTALLQKMIHIRKRRDGKNCDEQRTLPFVMMMSSGCPE